MTGNDMPPPAFGPRAGDLWKALGLLTRLPLPYPAFDPNDPRPAAHAAWAYPLVGLVIAGITILIANVALALGLPASAAALLGLLSAIIATGALHEDGLADCADGFWGGWTEERRLEIMKDSQIGTYGVIALSGVLGLRWIAVSALLNVPAWGFAILGAAIVSRAGMVWVMHTLSTARSSGLSGRTGRPPFGAAMIAIASGLLALLVTPAALWITLPLSLITVLGICRIAEAKISGQTGDVLGATQQIIETLILLACLAALT